MNCKDAVKLMSQEQDRRLQSGERFALRFHTLICVGCRNYRGQMVFLHTAGAERSRGTTEDGSQEN